MCDERERLIGYVYDESDAGERRAIDAHLETCAVCREEIRALRGVRDDLLAWDVPEHGSVWRPFAPARLTPWWREVPAWAMAVAATLVFMLGAAGGVVTHTFVSRDVAQAASTQAAMTPVATPVSNGVAAVPVGMSQAEQTAFEQRVLARLDDELDRRIQQVSVTTGGSKTDPQVARELRDLRASVNAQKKDFLDMMIMFTNENANFRQEANKRINQIDARVSGISYSVPGGNK